MRLLARKIAAAIVGLSGVLGWLAAEEKLNPAEVHFSGGIYTPPSLFTVKSESRLVEIDAVVQDRQGRLVSGLTLGDFQVSDEGAPRPLVMFSALRGPAAAGEAPAVPASPGESAPIPSPHERPASPSVAFFFDDLNGDIAEFGQSKQAASHYIKQGLGAGRAAIFVSSGWQVLPFGSNADQLAAAIEKLNARQRPAASSVCPTMTPYLAYLIANDLDHTALTAKAVELHACDPSMMGPPPPARAAPKRTSTPQVPNTDLFMDSPDAVRLVRIGRMVWQEQEQISRATLAALSGAILKLSLQPGPRVLVLASSGFLTGEALASDVLALKALAVRAGVTINTLDSKGVYNTRALTTSPNVEGRAANYPISLGSQPDEANNEILEDLAESTGGRFFAHNNDLEAGFQQLATPPTVSYQFGFAPPETPDGTFHKLKVTVPTHPGFTVTARPGYYSDTAKAEAPQERRIDREVFTDSSSRDARIGVNISTESKPGGAALLRAVFSVDVTTLPMEERAGMRMNTVSVLLAVLDEQGHFVTGREGAIQLALPPATFIHLTGKKLTATLELDVPAGKYRVRVLAEERNKGGMTAASQSLELQ